MPLFFSSRKTALKKHILSLPLALGLTLLVVMLGFSVCKADPQAMPTDKELDLVRENLAAMRKSLEAEE